MLTALYAQIKAYLTLIVAVLVTLRAYQDGSRMGPDPAMAEVMDAIHSALPESLNLDLVGTLNCLVGALGDAYREIGDLKAAR
jgi:hypothetical protein